MANADLVDDYVVRVHFGNMLGGSPGPWNSLTFVSPHKPTPVKITYTHQRQGGPGGTIGPAKLAVTIDDPDAEYDQMNPNGTYYTLLVADRPVELRASSNQWISGNRQLMWGYLDDIRPTWDSWQRRTTIEASDALRVLGQYELDDDSSPFNQYEFTGQRLDRVLDRLSWPAGFRGTIQNGTVLVPPGTASGNALAYIHELARAEGGTFWVTHDGDVEYWEHNAHLTRTGWSVVQAQFGDEAAVDATPGTIPIVQAPTNMTLGRFRRVHRVAASGHTGNTFWTGTAPTNFPPTSRRQSGLMSYFDADVAASARWYKDIWNYLYGSPTQIKVQVHPKNTDALTKVCDGSIQLLHRVEVTATPPGYSAPVTWDCAIEGIRHDITLERWIMTLDLSPYDALPQAADLFAWGDAFASTDGPAY